MDLKEIGHEGVDCINVADRDKLQAVVNTVIKFQIL